MWFFSQPRSPSFCLYIHWFHFNKIPSLWTTIYYNIRTYFSPPEISLAQPVEVYFWYMCNFTTSIVYILILMEIGVGLIMVQGARCWTSISRRSYSSWSQCKQSSGTLRVWDRALREPCVSGKSFEEGLLSLIGFLFV